MTASGIDTLGARKSIKAGGVSYDYFSLEAATASAGLGSVHRLPFSLKILLENLLRFEDGHSVCVADIKAMAAWLKNAKSDHEIAFRPARVLMQDFTGVPAVVDLAAMREAIAVKGGDPTKINPLLPVDLVIDHSLMVDKSGSADALKINIDMEFKRNRERYEFLRWGQQAFDNFRVVPPGTGICHQVNLEYLAQVVQDRDDGNLNPLAYPDTLVGTDSHTTMVNALAVLGWGVGGIEAEAAMLGQPISMLVPEVMGVKLTGKLPEGSTATDLVLSVVKMLREKGVVGKFVEFYGSGLDNLTLPDRATIANMAPEYGATCGFFPIDAETIHYMKLTSRPAQRIALTEAYAKAQGMWRDDDTPDPIFTDTLQLDISTVDSCISGPKRPQDKIALSTTKTAFSQTLKDISGEESPRRAEVKGKNFELRDGDLVIASITSCTNTSNPSVLIAAGLLARNAVTLGAKTRPWVKTSLAPGSQVVADYLKSAGLQKYLDKLGFNITGFGCTTCIGNSGPLDNKIVKAIEKDDLLAVAVLSGNRNFEGRISPHVKANYLASPPLVVAYAIAGTMNIDMLNEPLAKDKNGSPVFLKDIWPSNKDIQNVVDTCLTPAMFKKCYANISKGPQKWQTIKTSSATTYDWDEKSTYVRHPSFFTSAATISGDIIGARPLAIFGDSITTDHISPAGAIKADSPAGKYLMENGLKVADFNSYGSRRGNHLVMMRGTFANIRIRNEMAPGTEGGITRYQPSGKQMTIFDAAMKYEAQGVPLVIVAGNEYGTGSSRDWAAKGSRLLGIKAVVVESFERIHRSNLLGMGVLPLQFKGMVNRRTLKLDGSEVFDITGLGENVTAKMDVNCRIRRSNGEVEEISLLCRIDTEDEAKYYQAGGILQYVLAKM